MFFGFWKNVKNVKNVSLRSFTDHLITQPLITQLPEVSTGKSRSSTSNSLLRSVAQESMQLRIACVINAHKYPQHPEFWGQNFYRHSTNFFSFFVTMLASLRTKFLLPTFYVFFRVISKKRKKSCFFWNLEKNEKYVFSDTGPDHMRSWPFINMCDPFLTLMDQELIPHHYSSCSSSCWVDALRALQKA